MYIHFSDTTYDKLHFLASRDEKSVAAYIADQMDKHVARLVDTEYTFKDEDNSPKIKLLAQSGQFKNELCCEGHLSTECYVDYPSTRSR